MQFDHFFFDLDGTLYPNSCGLEDDLHERLDTYVSRYFNLERRQASELRRKSVAQHGSTLAWLLAGGYTFDVDEYFAFIHPEGEEAGLEKDPEVIGFFEALDAPASIITNSPREHAVRILERLGLSHRFEAVYDIRFNGLKGKPLAASYLGPLAAAGVAVERAFYVDDMHSCVEGFRSLGGAACLIDWDGNIPKEADRVIHRLPELINQISRI